MIQVEFGLDSYVHDRIGSFSRLFGRKVLGVSEGFAALIELCSGFLPLHEIDRLLCVAVKQSRGPRLEVWDLGYSVRPTGPQGFGAAGAVNLPFDKTRNIPRTKNRIFSKKELRDERVLR